jgi:hypothetical protein
MLPTLLLASALLPGGCGPGGCSVAPPLEWRRHPSDPGRSYLFRDGVQVAGYDHGADEYRTYDATTNTWGPVAAPPWKEPEKIAAPHRSSAVPNYGVDLDQLHGDREERYHLNGIPVSRDQARKAMAGGTIPDDAGRLRLTVIGDAESTSRVTKDLDANPALAAWKDRLVVQAYPPTHWAMAKAGFYTAGRPTIYVQTPAGQVLHRQDDYADGADGLAQALRRADPTYDPSKDADLRRSGLFSLGKVPAPVWILAAAVVILLFRRSA